MKFLNKTLDILDMLFSAGRVASAVDTRRIPDARDLRTLGIPQKDFASINLH